MSDVYEVVDTTDDEMYFTTGVYSKLELALASLDEPEPPQTYHCHDDWGCAKFDVRQRPLDTWSEGGEAVATVRWKMLPLEDDDEKQRWRRTVEVKALAGGKEKGDEPAS